MPKYYRFRVTSPTRRPRKSKEREKMTEIEKTKSEIERNWLDLTLAITPAPSWYLRRTSWREFPPIMGLPRHLAAGMRASLQLSNRPIFVLKFPATSYRQTFLDAMDQ